MESGSMKHLNNEKGIALVLVALLMLALLAVGGLAVDLAYVYFVKNHLQVAADAAALAGAAELFDQNDLMQSAAKAEAVKFAGKNDVCLAVQGGSNFLDYSNDVAVGFWNGSLFSPGAQPVNAIMVKARRTDNSPGGKVKLLFAGVVGWSSMQVAADAVAVRRVSTPSPIAANEYWYGDNPAQFVKTYPQRLYPHSYFRQYNVDGSKSNNWEFGTDPFGTNHGSVLCIAGENANPNNATQDAGGYVALDYRVDSYLGVPAHETWYMNSDFRFGGYGIGSHKFGKSDWAPHLDYYPGRLPITISEAALPVESYPPTFKEEGGKGGGKNKPPAEPPGGGPGGKEVKCPYDLPPPKDATSPSPFATLAYLPGVSVGLTLSDMIDGGSYRGDRYAPGKDIVVLVYDGLRQGDGNTKRVTLMGYARVRIVGYGNSLEGALANPTNKNGNSVYAYALEPLKECSSHEECQGILDTWAPRMGVLVR